MPRFEVQLVEAGLVQLWNEWNGDLQKKEPRDEVKKAAEQGKLGRIYVMDAKDESEAKQKALAANPGCVVMGCHKSN